MEMKPGTIIVLNGTATAGKSSLARAVQDVFPEPYLHLGLDTFVIHVAPRRYGTRGTHAAEGFSLIPVAGADPSETEFRYGPVAQALTSAMHHAIGSLAESGHNVVVDYCLQDPAWMDEWVVLWSRVPVVLVQVYCPLDVLEERAALRTDRTGLAARVPRWLFLRGLLHCPYDLTVDTSQMSPDEGALAIQRYMHEGSQPAAFKSLVSGSQHSLHA